MGSASEGSLDNDLAAALDDEVFEWRDDEEDNDGGGGNGFSRGARRHG